RPPPWRTPRRSRRTARGWGLPGGSRGSAWHAQPWSAFLGVRSVERIGEGDLPYSIELLVAIDVGVNEPGHRHLDPLPGLQGLLGEAEALDLVEVDARGVGRDVEDGGAGDGLRRAVFGDIVDGVHGADFAA